MKLNSLCVWTALALAVGATACTKSSPTRPTDTASAATSASVTEATTTAGITITTPQLVTPADGQRFRYAEQPLTLTVTNAATTGGTITYSFQVASDAGFASVVYSKDGVAQGSGATTSLKIDTLAGNKDYFWRARAVSGSAAGPYSKARGFNVGPQIVIQAPTLLSPANGGNSNGSQPTFTVGNASRTGPAGTISYQVSIADSASFGSILGSNTVTEQAGGQTTVSIDARLVPNVTYYWRAQALDLANGVSGPFSAVFSFRYVPFDLGQAVIVNSPQDLARWPETTRITMVNFVPGTSFQVDFDKRQSGDKWPETVPPGWSGGIQYTLGMCVNPSGQWYCSGVVQFWDGRSLDDSTPPSYVGRNWFYDGRWGPILGYQPSDGEQVGLFVGSGNLRDGNGFTMASCPRVCERSNVAMVTWHNEDAALFTFNLPGGRTLALGRKR